MSIGIWIAVWSQRWSFGLQLSLPGDWEGGLSGIAVSLSAGGVIELA